MKVITIGGGEISQFETLELDSFICRQTGKSEPKALFIPTASGDAKKYCKTFQHVYGKKLGCNVDFLLATHSNFSKQEGIKKILNADLVYVGGGNTQKMLEIWECYGVDVTLRQAGQNGTVLSGLSAGAICWYAAGFSDSERFASSEASNWSLKRIDALGFLPGVFCPHLDKEQRHEPLLNLVRLSGERAVACDNGAAIFWENGVAHVLTSLPGARAHVYTEQFGKVRIDRFASGERLPL